MCKSGCCGFWPITRKDVPGAEGLPDSPCLPGSIHRNFSGWGRPQLAVCVRRLFPLLVVTFCTVNVFYSTTAPKKSLTGVISGPLLQWAGMTKESLMETQLMLQVQQIFDESQQRFGAEKIRIILAENGIHVGKRGSEVFCRSLVWRVFEKMQRAIGVGCF